MKMVVTHLTRIQRGTICAAGLDIETGHHVRPILPMGVFQSKMTAPKGGPFDMATVVDLGVTRPVPSPPEVEDVEVTWWHARAVATVEPSLFWDMLRLVSRRSLRELFGPALRTFGRSGRQRAVTDLRSGSASLGVLVPLGRPRLSIDRKPDGREVVRMQFWDGERRLDLSVTDLRLYADDGARPDTALVEDVARRLQGGVPVMLGVGLTRPFASRPNEAPLHWLQVNNIHLEDDPCWRLAPAMGASPLVSATGVSPILPDRTVATSGVGAGLLDDDLPF